MIEVYVRKKVVLVASIVVFDDDVQTPEQIAEYINQNDQDLEDYQILDSSQTEDGWAPPTYTKEDIKGITKLKYVNGRIVND